MPAAPKTSDDAIVQASRKLIELGADDFSMAAVAAAVGVRTPSLYKRFADREELIGRVRRDAYAMLGAALSAAGARRRGRARVRAMADAYRTFALAHPRLYSLLFAPEIRADAATHEARLASVAPALDALRELAGERHALDAARALTAFLHGYVTMLIAGAFKLGGDVDVAFEYGIDRLLNGIAARP
jgi:AcrR family transcriptional regulator